MATATPKDDARIGAYIVATLLIVIGLFALVANVTGTGITALSIPLAIGLAFLVAYGLTRNYGLLVPAGVLTGFGGGALAGSVLNVADSGALVVIGGGLGFLFIYLVDMLVSGSSTRWWPLIPGGILTLVGAGIAQQAEALRQLALWWPVLLVVLGALILVERLRPQAKK